MWLQLVDTSTKSPPKCAMGNPLPENTFSHGCRSHLGGGEGVPVFGCSAWVRVLPGYQTETTILGVPEGKTHTHTHTQGEMFMNTVGPTVDTVCTGLASIGLARYFYGLLLLCSAGPFQMASGSFQVSKPASCKT